MPRGKGIKKLLVPAVAVAALLLAAPGCGGAPPTSESYFAIASGNSWLYEGEGLGESLQVEITVVEPEPSLELGGDIFDVSIEGTLGDYRVSDQGLFLEVAPGEIKLWGFKEEGGPPVFFDSPYVWLREPLVVGETYDTEIQAERTPAQMEVDEEVEVSTPWGDRSGFELEEKSGSGPAGGVRLTFVPYLGFTSIEIPGLPQIQLIDASLD